jgi:hypothetical protein
VSVYRWFILALLVLVLASSVALGSPASVMCGGEGSVTVSKVDGSAFAKTSPHAKRR